MKTFFRLIALICFFEMLMTANQAVASKGLNINSAQTTGMGAKRPPAKQNIESLKFPKKHPTRINWIKKLSLTNEQAQQVQNIYAESQSDIEQLQKQIEQAHKKIVEIYKQDDLKIREILTEQQQIKFDKEQRKMQQHQGLKPDGPRPSRKRMPQF